MDYRSDPVYTTLYGTVLNQVDEKRRLFKATRRNPDDDVFPLPSWKILARDFLDRSALYTS